MVTWMPRTLRQGVPKDSIAIWRKPGRIGQERPDFSQLTGDLAKIGRAGFLLRFKVKLVPARTVPPFLSSDVPSCRPP